MDFYCASELMVGLLGAFFLMGIAIGCFTLARSSDKKGRKKIFLFSMVILILCTGLYLFVGNIYVVYTISTVLGIVCCGKQVAGYTLLMEM